MGKSNRLHYRLGPAELFPNFALQTRACRVVSKFCCPGWVSFHTVSIIMESGCIGNILLIQGNSTMQKSSGTCKIPDKSSLGSSSLKSLCGWRDVFFLSPWTNISKECCKCFAVQSDCSVNILWKHSLSKMLWWVWSDLCTVVKYDS